MQRESRDYLCLHFLGLHFCLLFLLKVMTYQLVKDNPAKRIKCKRYGQLKVSRF